MTNTNRKDLTCQPILELGLTTKEKIFSINVSIYAPYAEIGIHFYDGTTPIDDNKNWKEFKNGELLNEYNGNTLPGCSDFNKYRDEDKNKIFNNNSWELWEKSLLSF